MSHSTIKGKRRFALTVVSTLAMLVFSVSAQAILVNHWTFDANGGDSGSSGNLATLQNGASIDNTQVAPNGSIGSLKLDGANDRANALGYKAPLVGGTNSRTVAAWVKTAPGININNHNFAIASYGQNQNGDKFILRSQTDQGTINGNLRFEVNGGYVTGTDIIANGDWHHVAMTWENDGTPNVVDTKLYVDGALQAFNKTATNVVHTDTANGSNFRIGDGHGNDNFDGWIDDVRVYNEVLSAGQIADLAAPVEMDIVAGFTKDFQAGTPPTNWEYLWNGPDGWPGGGTQGSSDPIGDPANYDDLVWNGSGNYTPDGDATNGNNQPSAFSRLGVNGAGTIGRVHPALGDGQAGGVGNSQDRYMIAAYTITMNGTYAIADSFLENLAAAGNGNEVLVHINGDPAIFSGTIDNGTINFDTFLGELSAGDVVYVAIGPNGAAGSDSAEFDFNIVKYAGQDVPEPATATLAMLGLGGLLMRRRRLA
jgi:uncharacterized protein (TIGR03382 family)